MEKPYRIAALASSLDPQLTQEATAGQQAIQFSKYTDLVTAMPIVLLNLTKFSTTLHNLESPGLSQRRNLELAEVPNLDRLEESQFLRT